MRNIKYEFICDECGKTVVEEAKVIDSKQSNLPDGWGEFKTVDKQYHFDKESCFSKFWDKYQVGLKEEKKPKFNSV